MIFNRHANLKYKYGSRHFWAKAYFCDTVRKCINKINIFTKKKMTKKQVENI